MIRLAALHKRCPRFEGVGQGRPPLYPLLSKKGAGRGLILELGAQGGFDFLSGIHFDGVLGVGIEAGGASAVNALTTLESGLSGTPSVKEPPKGSALCLSRRFLTELA